MINHKQQLTHCQYIYQIYYKLLYLQYLQNLSSEPQGTYTYDAAQQKLTEIINYGTETFSLTYAYHPDGQKASYTGIDNTTYNYFSRMLGGQF